MTLNDPVFGDRYEIAVKREAAERGGFTITCRWGRSRRGSPRGAAPLGPAPQLFTAGGIGVSPFLSACAALRRAARSDFHLHIMARGAPPLGAALNGLISAGPATMRDTASVPRARRSATT
ncbi:MULTISPECIES: hypothetical protein [unclassified Xanthobacter]|uniref:hypothetical protein n=1 Tax=unclassified Xanthobacter TaxID=2623496 RepID=UPI001F481108|nr:MULTISPECIES: hypothetical protein [unclassified Xanthobacter]